MTSSFGFCAGGERLALHIPERRTSHWSQERGEVSEVRARVACEWSVEGGALTLVSDDAEGPGALAPGWSVESGAISVFAHRGGARVFVPSYGPWQTNPSAPNIVAGRGGMFELRGAVPR